MAVQAEQITEAELAAIEEDLLGWIGQGATLHWAIAGRRHGSRSAYPAGKHQVGKRNGELHIGSLRDNYLLPDGIGLKITPLSGEILEGTQEFWDNQPGSGRRTEKRVINPATSYKYGRLLSLKLVTNSENRSAAVGVNLGVLGHPGGAESQNDDCSVTIPGDKLALMEFKLVSTPPLPEAYDVIGLASRGEWST